MDNSSEGKLVRDRIPEVIREKGGIPITRIANEAEYSERLRTKLMEEVTEFLHADEEEALDELADILEVLHALTKDMGFGLKELEMRRLDKKFTRGGFDKRIVWLGNED